MGHPDTLTLAKHECGTLSSSRLFMSITFDLWHRMTGILRTGVDPLGREGCCSRWRIARSSHTSEQCKINLVKAPP